MMLIDLIKKYMKFNEFSKAISVAFKNIHSLEIDEQKAIIDYLLDDVLLPMDNQSVIKELGATIQDNNELYQYFNDKLPKTDFSKNTEIILDCKKIAKINSIFEQLDLTQPQADHLNIKTKIVDLEEAKTLIYEDYSELKLSIIKAVNKDFFQIKNRNEIEKLIEQIIFKLDEKLQTTDDPVLSLFIDEINFDVELIVKSFLFHENRLAEDILSIYQSNLMPCGWNGLYPEGIPMCTGLL